MAFQTKAAGNFGEPFKFVEEGDQLEGYYMGSKTITINGDSVLSHTIQTDAGLRSTLGSHNLNQGLDGIPVGTKVRITFEEMKKLKKGKTLKIFKVEFDEEDTIATGGMTASSVNAKAAINGAQLKN